MSDTVIDKPVDDSDYFYSKVGKCATCNRTLLTSTSKRFGKCRSCRGDKMGRPRFTNLEINITGNPEESRR